MFGFSMDSELAKFRLYLARRNLKSRTIQLNSDHLRKLLQACDPFSSETFASFLSSHSRNYSAASLNKYILTAKYYVEMNSLEFDQSLLRKFKETPKTRGTLTDAEIEAFLDLPPGPKDRGAHKKMSCFWSICAFTGMRMGEVAVLRQANIDLASQTIIVTQSKTGTGRVIKIPGLLFTILSSYVKTLETDLLFSNRSDQPISADTWLLDFKKRIQALGIKKSVQPYSFRHTLATKLLSNDAALFAVQDILGHTDPKTTRMYYHGNLKAQEKAFNKDTLSRKHLGGSHLIQQIDEFIDGLNLVSVTDIDYIKIMEAKKLLYESIKKT